MAEAEDTGRCLWCPADWDNSGFCKWELADPGRLPVAPCEGSQERRRGTWPWKRYCYNVNTWSSCSASLATDLLQSHEGTLKKSNKTRVFSVFKLAFNQWIFHFFQKNPSNIKHLCPSDEKTAKRCSASFLFVSAETKQKKKKPASCILLPTICQIEVNGPVIANGLFS